MKQFQKVLIQVENEDTEARECIGIGGDYGYLSN